MTIITVTVGKPAHGGSCVARHEGRAVFVRHALPGEVVEARVVDPQPDARFWVADVVRVLEPSPSRITHPWEDASIRGVGGAELGHASLAAQREWKTAVVHEAFERFAKMAFPGELKPAPGDDSRNGLAYRTRVSAIADADGRASMAPAGGGERVRLTAMPLAVEAAEEALLAVRAAPGERIDVAVDASGNAVIGSGASTRKAALTERVSVDGTPLQYRLTLADFWQVHREAPGVLVGEVLSRLGKANRVLDLYAGAGLFSAAIASQGRDVMAVEIGTQSRSSLERNLARFPHANAVMGDARSVVRSMASAGDSWEGGAVVLDPPRSGAKAATIEAIAALEPSRIVYVACDPVALARDVALLAQQGYALEDAQAWDLFPLTHHIETVASFVRAGREEGPSASVG